MELSGQSYDMEINCGCRLFSKWDSEVFVDELPKVDEKGRIIRWWKDHSCENLEVYRKYKTFKRYYVPKGRLREKLFPQKAHADDDSRAVSGATPRPTPELLFKVDDDSKLSEGMARDNQTEARQESLQEANDGRETARSGLVLDTLFRDVA